MLVTYSAYLTVNLKVYAFDDSIKDSDKDKKEDTKGTSNEDIIAKTEPLIIQ